MVKHHLDILISDGQLRFIYTLLLYMTIPSQKANHLQSNVQGAF